MQLLEAIRDVADVRYFTDNVNKQEALLRCGFPACKKAVTLIAITGQSAAGKTTLLNAIKEKVENVSVISADNYYKDISDLMKTYGSFTGLVEDGYDAESAKAFQMKKLEQDLKDIKKGKDIWMPHYDMVTGKSTSDAILFQPNKIVVVEGICTFYPEIRNLFDVKIFLHVEKENQRKRYFERASERGQDPSQIENQYELVCEAAKKYILPNKRYADLVVERRISQVENMQENQVSVDEKQSTQSIQSGDKKSTKTPPKFNSIYDKAFWEYYRGGGRERDNQ